MKVDKLWDLATQYGYTGAADPARFSAYLKEQGVDTEHMYQELEMSARYVNTHLDVNNSAIALHSHAFYEMLYCENSCGVEYLVGTRRYQLMRGDVILIPPGVSHRPLIPEHIAEPYRRDVVWMSQEFMDWVVDGFEPFFSLHGLPLDNFLLRTRGTTWENIGDSFRAGVREAERRAPGWEAWVVGNTLTLITRLCRASARGDVPTLKPEDSELLDLVVAYIEEHLAEPITVSDVADHFFVSKSTVTHTFCQKMGVSFYRCVTQRRLISAKTLLLQGTPPSQVNGQVGFSDYSSFYRAFKREYGISPRQFQQLQRRPQ